MREMQVKCNVLDRQFQMYQQEYEEAALRVLRSGWYVLGNEVAQLKKNLRLLRVGIFAWD